MDGLVRCIYPAVQILVTNTDKLLGWPFEEVGREELRDGGLGDRIQSEGTHTGAESEGIQYRK